MNVAIQREATVYDEPEVIARSAQELVGDLNPQQAEAVQYRGQALLIGAGAGSGKTRVLTRRIAWILSQFGAWPSQILAITFTNKAAAEMRERLGSLIGPVAQRMWVSTFHSACVRILRRDGKSIGLKSGFSIYDSADSERLVKIIATEFNLDIKRYTPRSILGHISDLKNNLTGWKENLAVHAPDFTPGQRGYQFGTVGDLEAIYAVIYAEYEHRLALANAVDFDDLIAVRHCLPSGRPSWKRSRQNLPPPKPRALSAKRPCWTTTTRISSTPRKSSTINSPSRSTRWTSSLGCCLPSFFCFWCWA